MDLITLWLLYKGIKLLIDDTGQKLDKNSEQIEHAVISIKGSSSKAIGNFEALRNLYQTSKVLADEAFRRKTELNEFIQKLIQGRKQEIERKHKLISEKKELRGDGRNQMQLEIDKLSKEIEEFTSKIDIATNTKNEFLSKVKSYNRDTSELAILIKDTCGNGGKIWYDRRHEGK